MRISDWSSDVCSSDLGGGPGRKPLRQVDPDARLAHQGRPREGGDPHKESARLAHLGRPRAAKPPDCTRHSHLDGVSFTTRAADLPCRSEEHTSELQSLMRISYAVFCLKKKNIDTR